MKKLLGIAVFAAALAYGAVATAAPINITATQQSAGSTQWTLTIDTSLPVAGIAIVATDTATFAQSAAANVAPIGSGSSYGEGATPGLFSLVLGPATCSGINCSVFASSSTGTVNLGTFTVTGAFFLGPDDGSNGFTAGDGTLTPYDENQVSVTSVPFPVPEPVTAVLLGLGLATLGLVRRKAA